MDKSWQAGTQYFNGEVKLVNPGVSNGGQTIQEIWDVDDPVWLTQELLLKSKVRDS